MARFAFATLLAHSLCAICRPENVRSAAVMERLGMRYVGIEHWYAADMSRFSMSRGDWQQRVDANGL
jgi:RimJ/RimL family protein N-acetyltransferase